MKLAFVDNLAVGGGISRFSYLLCESLVAYSEEMQIDYYVHYENLKRTPELHHMGARVKIIPLESTRPISLIKRITGRLAKKLSVKGNPGDALKKEIESKVIGYDIAYFPSAHMMERPNLQVAVVGTLHDFNWKYFFGQSIFPLSFVKMMDAEIMKWMQGYNVCSSHDVVNEAKKLYPSAVRYPAVVPIAPVVMHKVVTEEKALSIMRSLNIDFPYIIFPGNFYPHKNHLNLFTAFSLLRKRPGFENYKLILTGMNSEQVPYGIAEYRGVQLLTSVSSNTFYDIRGMGYQSNEVIDVLIQKAKLLVSPSIYEAICTPAMDAWNFGTPTAISDIPPFREHETAWGVTSAFFDPMDAQDMAAVIENCIVNYNETAASGLLSKKKMAEYTWQKVAAGYMEVFKKALDNK